MSRQTERGQRMSHDCKGVSMCVLYLTGHVLLTYRIGLDRALRFVDFCT
jgi:hypothetical protein